MGWGGLSRGVCLPLAETALPGGRSSFGGQGEAERGSAMV